MRIDVFDYDLELGVMRNRRTFVEIDEADGLPDGLTLDAAGGVWVALYGGGAVHRYGPDGQLTTRMEVPGAALVTSCCFGGPDLGDLYISPSTEDLDPTALAAQPNAGRIFVAHPGERGRPAPVFLG